MSVLVHIPPVLRGCTDQQKQVRLDGPDVGAVLRELVRRHPALQDHLLSGTDALQSLMKIYVNEEDIRYLHGEQTKLQDGDVLTLVPSAARDLRGDAPRRAGGPDPASLSREELERYSRHLVIPEFGVRGQIRLKESSVLCIGVGGLGSPFALYLAAAGIGRLGLVDFDVVDASNLQRQVLHGTRDVGRSKLVSARDAIHDINPHVQVDLHETRLSAENALELLAPYDLVADGSDNFPTRYLVNDACVLLGKPNVYGSVFRFDGQASLFHAPHGPCYRCLYPEPPPPGLIPSCAEGGVLGILPGIIGLIQATETIKWLTGLGTSLLGRLLVFNALSMTFQEFALQKDPDCPICGEHPTLMSLKEYGPQCSASPANGIAGSASVPEISPRALKEELDAGKRPLLLDVREPHEYEICRLQGAVLMPLGQVESRLHELNRSTEMVVYCRSGGRSAQAVMLLQRAGFPKVRNLAGGTLAWSDQVDPQMPKY